MSKLKQLKEQRSSKFNDLENLRKEGESRNLSAEEETRYDSLFAEVEKLDKQIANEERFLKMSQDRAKENQEGEDAKSSEEEERALFKEYLKGNKPLEQRSDITGVNGTATIPATISKKVDVALKNYGGVFDVAEIITTSTGGDLSLPTFNDTANKATILGASGTITKGSMKINAVVMKAYTYVTPLIPIPWNLIQDSAVDVESIVVDALADRFNRGVAADLTIGTGVDQPLGIVTAATACATEAPEASIRISDLIDLKKSVNAAYQRNAKFMFNSNTEAELAKITDSTGRPILFTDYSGGMPSKLLGKPYVINDDMPDIGAEQSSVIYGDLSKYKVRIVKDYNVKRLNESLAESLSVGIFGYGRMDGRLVDAGTHPIYKLVHAEAVVVEDDDLN